MDDGGAMREATSGPKWRAGSMAEAGSESDRAKRSAEKVRSSIDLAQLWCEALQQEGGGGVTRTAAATSSVGR